MRRHLLLVVFVLLAFAVLTAFSATTAKAAGASYAVDGGTPAEQRTIRAALAASSFDWSVIPVKVTVHVVRGIQSHAGPGHVWLDPELLATGKFAWAVVQDEFAHQVDFLRLDADARATLNRALGTKVWCHADQPGLPHGAYGCERFTSSLVWAYWENPDNAYRPAGRNSEALTDTALFRSVLASQLARVIPSVPATSA